MSVDFFQVLRPDLGRKIIEIRPEHADLVNEHIPGEGFPGK